MSDSRKDRHYLVAIHSKLDRILVMMERYMATLEETKQDIERQTTVVESAVTLLGDLSAKIKEYAEAGASLEEWKGLAASIDANTDTLAGAVARNTPAVQPGAAEPEPQPVTEPIPEPEPAPEV